jgi:NitT/TauT family transport system ATP-binding protein
MLKIENLSLSYGENKVFYGLDLSFEEGSINVILGASGVGKTSLLNCIAGLLPFEGSIEGNNRVSYMFQSDRLIGEITVQDNLELVLRKDIKDKTLRRAKIKDILETLEIGDSARKLPSELSGGQAQRVAMARAYLYPADILLMDEPFKSLDTALKARLLSNLVALNKKIPRTVVFVTHMIDECLMSGDRAIILSGNPAAVTFDEKIEASEKRTLSDENLQGVRARLLTALGL